MKVCILSDSHDNRELLAAAVREAKALGATVVLHCGDVVAASTLSVLQPLGLPVHVIHGNNSGDLYTLAKMANRDGSVIRFHGQDAGIHLAGRRIFLVHYPHYAHAMSTTGDWDLVCCGHSHEAAIQRVRNVNGTWTTLVNPGTVGGVDRAPTYVVGELEEMRFETRAVSLATPAIEDLGPAGADWAPTAAS